MPGDPGGNAFLYALVIGTGVSTKLPLDRLYTLGPMAPDGRLIGAYWDGANEAVVLIDPATGSTTQIGVFGDLFTWENQIAYDPDKHVTFTIGMDRNDVSHIYRVVLGP